MNPPLCLFHRADLDGVCSAAIVKKFVPDAELHGIDYGDEFPWHKVASEDCANAMKDSGEVPHDWRRTVYLVDFSLKREEMEMLAAYAHLIWCDHHKSALEDCAGLDILGCRSTKRSGCELTWEWCSTEFLGELSEPPEAVRLLGRYDVWDAQNPDWPRIEAFQFGMRSLRGAMDPADPMWEERFLSESGDSNAFNIATTVERGLGVLSYRDQEAKSQCADAHVEYLFPPEAPFKNQWANRGMSEAWTAICLNALQRGSWLFKSVWDPAKHDAMCVYGRLKDGRWRVSLYSTKPEVDCGAIAKAFGGGGHKGAAGFICDKLPWEK